MSETNSKIASIEKRIARHKRDSEANETRLRDAIAQAEERGATRDALENMRANLENYEAMTKYTDASMQAELDDLKAQKEAEDKKEAQEQADREAKEHDRALGLWLAEGGKAADFEAAWPVIRAEMFKNAILIKLGKELDEKRALYSGML